MRGVVLVLCVAAAAGFQPHRQISQTISVARVQMSSKPEFVKPESPLVDRVSSYAEVTWMV